MTGIKLDDDHIYEANYVIVVPGREGSDWFYQESKRLGLKSKK